MVTIENYLKMLIENFPHTQKASLMPSKAKTLTILIVKKIVSRAPL